MIILEEELYESKSTCLELLDSIKELEIENESLIKNYVHKVEYL